MDVGGIQHERNEPGSVKDTEMGTWHLLATLLSLLVSLVVDSRPCWEQEKVSFVGFGCGRALSTQVFLPTSWSVSL